MKKADVEYIAQPRRSVFEAGVIAENWPDIRGLRLEPQDDELKKGGKLVIGLDVPILSQDIEGTVVRFSRGKHIQIDGESHLGPVIVRFSLSDHEDGVGTEIAYTLSVEPLGRRARMALMAVSQLVDRRLPEFVEAYRDNVHAHIEANGSPMAV